MPETVKPLLLNGQAAAAFLAISRSKFLALVREGRIQRVRIDGATRFLVSHLEAFAADSLESDEQVQPGRAKGPRPATGGSK